VPQPRTQNWRWLAAISGAAGAWQIYEIATATEAPRQALALMQYFSVGCALVGFVGSLIMLAKGKSA
jgi:hypothetical protein